MALTWRLLSPPPPAAEAAVSTDRPYVLVVPFDVSGEASETWQPFADQATREVIRNLRKVSGLRVVPVTSAFTFKGNKSRTHIRAQLPEVRYVLDGVVTVAADKTLRITAELEDLHKGGTVWDQDYTGRADDTNLFAMQSGIAAAVSQSLKVAILDDELRAMGELPTSNLKAYELHVAGRHQLNWSATSRCRRRSRSSTRLSRWTRNSSTPSSPAAMPTVSCSPTSSRRSTCCGP